MGTTVHVAPDANAPRRVVLALQRVGGATEAALFNDAVVEWKAKAQVFQVVSQADIRALLGLERQEQLIGPRPWRMLGSPSLSQGEPFAR
jgi:hypothetical protein